MPKAAPSGSRWRWRGGTEHCAAIDTRGDNAATWHALRALSGGDYSNYGLVTLDAHLDMRDGVSNGSPVRQLLEDGLDLITSSRSDWPISRTRRPTRGARTTPGSP